MKRGVLYGIGVGPGDPELMTLKAVRQIQECDAVAVPVRNGAEARQTDEAKEAAAYRIALSAVPEIEEKPLIPVYTPMVRDSEILEQAHRQSVQRIEARLERGENVAYLVLGDASVYSSFSYIMSPVQNDGFEVQVTAGVPSFCAAAARLAVPLAEWSEPLHILPAAYECSDALRQPGTCVLMKTGKKMPEVKNALESSGRKVFAAESVGFPEERLYYGAGEIPDDAGYFTLIIAKQMH